MRESQQRNGNIKNGNSRTKTTIAEIKYPLGGPNSRLKTETERVSESKDAAGEIIQSDGKERTKVTRPATCDSIKQSDTHVSSASECKNDIEAQKCFEEIIGNFPKLDLKQLTDPRILVNPKQDKYKEHHTWPLNSDKNQKLKKKKEKERKKNKKLQSSERKNTPQTREKTTTADFSSETMGDRGQWNDISKKLKTKIAHQEFCI